MDTPYGPHRIQPSRQVAIPKELAERLSLRVGDQVYFMTNDQEPGTLTIVPVELMSRWLEQGRRPSGEEHRSGDAPRGGHALGDLN